MCLTGVILTKVARTNETNIYYSMIRIWHDIILIIMFIVLYISTDVSDETTIVQYFLSPFEAE